MGRRSPSYSPPPRRGYSGRGRSPSPRGHYPPRRDPPTSLLVRNLSKDCRAEDLHGPFGRFGPIRDIYLPRDYYTGRALVTFITREPRGFGFVQYLDQLDAEDAQYYMNHQILHGREITVVFAEENRKKPAEMRSKERVRGRSSYDGRRRSLDYARSQSRSPRYRSHSPRGQRYSRSRSPHNRRHRERSYSKSPGKSHNRYSRSPSPTRHFHKRRRERSPSHSRKSSPVKEARHSTRYSRSPPRSPSPPPRRQHTSHLQHSHSCPLFH